MSDNERRQWVENDEGLYLLWKRSGVGLYRWVRENRDEIDSILDVPKPKKHDTTWTTGYGEVRR